MQTLKLHKYFVLCAEIITYVDFSQSSPIFSTLTPIDEVSLCFIIRIYVLLRSDPIPHVTLQGLFVPFEILSFQVFITIFLFCSLMLLSYEIITYGKLKFRMIPISVTLEPGAPRKITNPQPISS